MKKPLNLSAAERLILQSYCTLLDGFASYFGGGYEFVLHSMESLDHSVIKIVNGHHTGRKIGAPVTDLALSMLARLEAQGGATYVTYGNRTKRGEPLHSSTIAIKGEKGRTIGLLCINFYLNTPLNQIFSDLFKTTLESNGNVKENFAANVEETVSEAVQAARRRVEAQDGRNALIENKKIVEDLYCQGIFKLKGAVQTVAESLGISKNTVYLHLRALDADHASSK
ncbi:hypothetical protein AWV80_41150 [Cupriavidus sp. UYMU48A]|nr:hypothetical protein AWV80_41150 [Cupriavidus sp. UYMU48A]